MKKIAFAAMALAALVGFMGCDTGSNAENDDPAVTYSSWWIKGSFDSWSDSPKHYFMVDEIDENTLSYEITGLYKHSTIPIVYEFVLVNPDGKEYKIEGAKDTVSKQTPGTAFTLGDSSAAGSTTLANVGFEAAMTSYTVTVDITTATAPSVNLVVGTTAAPEVTDEVLLGKLEVKGNQFSEINGAAVDAWTATAGTTTATTMSWDVLVDNKNGEFGFNSIDGYLKDATIDVAALTAGGAASAADALSNSSGNNCKLTGMPKAGAVYTLTVTVDTTKTVADGRYSLTAALKTESDTDWAFEPWETLFINGNGLGADFGEWASQELTIANDAGTFEFVANLDVASFKPSRATAWSGDVGFSGITQGEGSLTLSDNGNISFATTVGSTYRITIAFTGTYLTDGKPVITAVLVP